MPIQDIINQCSPTLAGLKTGSLFSARMKSRRQINEECSICYLARCTAAPMAAELLSVLTFHHPRDSNRSAEKMYLPPYSSE